MLNALKKKILDTYAAFHKISPEEIAFFLDLYYLLFKKRKITYDLYLPKGVSYLKNPFIRRFWRRQLYEYLDYRMDDACRVYQPYKHVILLNLGGYALTQIPNSISLLLKLRYLSLGFNNFKSLPTSIGKFKNLHELNLRYNHLTDLPKFLRNLPKLKSLLLSGNPISKTPVIISELESLKILDLNNIPMTSVSDSIMKIAEKYYAPYYINQGVVSHDAVILGLCEIFIGKYELEHNQYFEKESCKDGILWYGCPKFSYVLNEYGNIILLGLSMGQGIIEPNFQTFRCPEEVCDLPKLEEIWLRGGCYKPDLESVRDFNKEQSEKYKIYSG